MKYHSKDPVRVKREVAAAARDLEAIKKEREVISSELAKLRDTATRERVARQIDQDLALAELTKISDTEARARQDIIVLERQRATLQANLEHLRLETKAELERRQQEARGVSNRQSYLSGLVSGLAAEHDSLVSIVKGVEKEINLLNTQRQQLYRTLSGLKRERDQLASEVANFNEVLKQKSALAARWTEREELIDRRERTSKAMLARLDEKWLKHYQALPHKNDIQ